jgi:hypothetical protein
MFVKGLEDVPPVPLIITFLVRLQVQNLAYRKHCSIPHQCIEGSSKTGDKIFVGRSANCE